LNAVGVGITTAIVRCTQVLVLSCGLAILFSVGSGRATPSVSSVTEFAVAFDGSQRDDAGGARIASAVVLRTRRHIRANQASADEAKLAGASTRAS